MPSPAAADFLILDRLRRGRLGGLRLWSARVFTALMVGGYLWVAGLLLAILLGLPSKEFPPLGRLAMLPFLAFQTAVVVWCIRALTGGARVNGDGSVTVYAIGPDRRYNRAEIDRFLGDRDGERGVSLRLANGHEIPMAAVNMTGPWRRRKIAERLNREMSA